MQLASKRKTERKQILCPVFSGRHCFVFCWNKVSENYFSFLKPIVNQNYFSGGTENKKVVARREEKVFPNHQTAETTMLETDYLNKTDK